MHGNKTTLIKYYTIKSYNYIECNCKMINLLSKIRNKDSPLFVIVYQLTDVHIAASACRAHYKTREFLIQLV